MNETYYSVEQISQMLSIHPKTIQRYIREGKLRASKIGKSWRVSGHDLSIFTEGETNTADQRTDISSQKRIEASAVIDIEVSGREEASRMMNFLNASMIGKPPEYGKSSMQVQFLESDNKVRIMLWGNVKFMSAIMSSIQVLVNQ